MGKKKAKSKRNNELKIIFFIILIAAALFIVSTYAWFSTQKNISITNLQGIVEVAEGLEVSLNAQHWFNEIVLGTEEGQFNITDASTDYGPYAGHRNLSPSEMLPVSTLGFLKTSPATMTDLEMLRGKVTNTVQLSEIVVTDETITNSGDSKFAGYFAFDLFLKNSSKEETADELQLNYDSSLQITDPDKSQTGLQNTARVAFVRYGSTQLADGSWSGVSDVDTDVQDTILKETGAIEGGNKVYITDCAIWEPNSNDHVDYIVKSNNTITWPEGQAYGNLVDKKYKFTETTQMPTYALKKEAVGQEIDDIYDWSGTNTATLQKQTVLQTTKFSETDYTPKEGVQYLVSTTDPTGSTKFTIAPNSIVRLRVYVWLEGQDVDCINYASHGGGITINLGLVKKSEVGSRGEVGSIEP